MRELTDHEIRYISGGCDQNDDDAYSPTGEIIVKPPEGPDEEIIDSSISPWLKWLLGI